jgi:hypothetical protein
MAFLNEFAASAGRDFKIIRNTVNSGSIMKQWLKAAEVTSGDYLWIAEADDLAAPDFLRQLTAKMSKDTLFAFSDSSQIDVSGAELAASYNYYFNRFHGDTFKHSFGCPAADFAKRYLAISNIVLNVSAVLFDRAVLGNFLRSDIGELSSYRFAGDWAVYLRLCKSDGYVRFIANSLNVHRRHAGSATHSTAQMDHVREINRVHDTFADLFGEDATIQQRQQRYRAELRQSFGLPDGFLPG